MNENLPLVLWCQCSAGNRHGHPGNASNGIWNGWRSYIDNVQRFLDWRDMECIFHNPFGRWDTNIVHFDQYLIAKQNGARFFVDDFRRQLARVPNKTFYIGSPHNVVNKESNYFVPFRDQQLELFEDCGIALDNTGRIDIDELKYDRTVETFTYCKDRYFKAYVEATVVRGHIYFNEPMIVRYPTFHRWHVQGTGNFPRVGDDDWYPIPPTVLISWDDGGKNAAGCYQLIRDCWEMGVIPAPNTGVLNHVLNYLEAW